MNGRDPSDDQSLTGASRARRLPTRVSNACDRCRKLKQRCDVLRPCSTCTHANRECTESTVTKAAPSNARPPKRPRRASTTASIPLQTGPTEQASTRSPQSPVQQWTRPSPQDPNRTKATPASSTTSVPRLSDASRENRSIVAEFGSSNSAMDVTRRVLQQRGSDQSSDRAFFAIPGNDLGARRDSAVTYHPVSVLIGVDLPSKPICDKLLDIYFITVHWFSLVVYEPTFRKRYQAVVSSNSARPSDRPFLLLLLMVLVMSCQYGHGLADHDLQSTIDLDAMRIGYLKTVRQHFMDLLDEDSLEFVQICTLLGSYWLYWGKPRSSFTILGAAIKSAQAISLHRQANWRIANNDVHMVEESKRVWWTIYTWDRFATVVYGRPLGISDKDCDILMPAEFAEHLVDPKTLEAADLILSSYQVQLNAVYQLASPLLENIYGIRSLGDKLLSETVQTVEAVNAAMMAWRRDLPTHLDLDQIPDILPQFALRERTYSLQALSLHLTYLNLMIIIHRPLLADWQSRKTRESRAQSFHGSSESDDDEFTGPEKHIYDAGLQQCLKAALTISQLEQSKPALVYLAGQTHLMSFLAMNVFTSSIVLFICALADTLSDASQEAKRGMARNLRILRSLSATGSLPGQCSTIIQDLIQVVMDKEKEQMLFGPLDDQTRSMGRIATTQASQDQHRSISLGTASSHSADFLSTQGSRLMGPQANHAFNAAGEPPGAPFGRTMEHLHRVIKNTSQARAMQHTGVSVSQPSVSTREQNRTQQNMDSAWSNPMSWDAAYLLGGETYPQDMNQFWLWNMDNENQTSWSNSIWG